MSSAIFLDNNATTQIAPEVLDAMQAVWQRSALNASSQHRFGTTARRDLESARETISRLLGLYLADIHADQLLFTSGGTEANNLALLGVVESADPTFSCSSVVVSAIEHPSVLAAAEYLASRGCRVDQLSCNPNGQIETGNLPRIVERNARDGKPVRLVSLMLANNETGVIQTLEHAAAYCRAANIPLHTDSVQAFGKIPIGFRDVGVDLMTVTAHKLHGPVGIGALAIRHGVSIAPQIYGGFQQLGMRPGTEPVALAVGFAHATKLAIESLNAREQHLCELRDRLETGILRACSSAKVIGEGSPRLPHTTCMAFPGHDRQSLLMAFDMAGIACGTGSACASGSSRPSHVLQAMHCSEALQKSAMRFSVSILLTHAEINRAVSTIARIVNR